MRTFQHLLRDSFGSVLLRRLAVGFDLDRSWFLAPKSVVKGGKVQGMAAGHHISLHVDLSLADMFNNLGSKKFYRLVMRVQPVILGKEGLDKYLTVVNTTDRKNPSEIKEYPLVVGMDATDLDKFFKRIGPATSLTDIIEVARGLGHDSEELQGHLNQMQKALSDVTKFIERKNPGLHQGSWRPSYSSNDIK